MIDEKKLDLGKEFDSALILDNWCVVRCRKAASFVGRVAYIKDTEVHMTSARRLWGIQINGKDIKDSSEIARYGIVPEKSKLSHTTDFLVVFDACDILPLADEIAMTMVNAPVYFPTVD
jgi:hypothetical protein